MAHIYIMMNKGLFRMNLYYNSSIGKSEVIIAFQINGNEV